MLWPVLVVAARSACTSTSGHRRSADTFRYNPRLPVSPWRMARSRYNRSTNDGNCRSASFPPRTVCVWREHGALGLVELVQCRAVFQDCRSGAGFARSADGPAERSSQCSQEILQRYSSCSVTIHLGGRDDKARGANDRFTDGWERRIHREWVKCRMDSSGRVRSHAAVSRCPICRCICLLVRPTISPSDSGFWSNGTGN